MIPEGHEVYVINQIFDEYIDISEIISRYSIKGARCYHPLMLLKVIYYAYHQGQRSCRKIETLCGMDIRFMFLSGNQKPDHATINLFRKNNKDLIEEIFLTTNKVADKLGLIGHQIGAPDGTKIKANASVSKAKKKEWIEKKKKEIQEYLEEAEKIDEEEDRKYADRDSTKVSQELQNRKNISKKLQELKRLEEIEKKMEDEGKEKSNITDPDANIMKFADGSKKPGYNLQTMTDGKRQIITSIVVTTEQNDINQLIPVLEETKKNIGRLPEHIPADAGYFSYNNLEYAKENDIDVYIPDNRFKIEENGKEKYFGKEKFCYDPTNDKYICPEKKEMIFHHEQLTQDEIRIRIYKGTSCDNCIVKNKCTKAEFRTISRDPREYLLNDMRKKLRSEKGKEIYAKRKKIVEPPFGDWKSNNGFGNFLLRGKIGATIEANLFGAVHNIKKILRWLQGGNFKNRGVKVNAEAYSNNQISLKEFESEPFLVKFGLNTDGFYENCAVSC
jgi:transposase